MARTTYQDLLDAGVHFGHLTRKWNPKMAPYIFMERNGIHIIDLNKTLSKTEEAAAAIKQIVKSGRKILFVSTKKQAKGIVAEQAAKVNMPFVTERWLGGMLTNFATVRKSIKKMGNIDKMTKDGTYTILSKKERLMIQRERIKLESLLGGIADLNRLPAALFLVDVKREHIAVTEALKLNIPTFAMVDTNSDPSNIDFPIPSNDDATKSITLITDIVVNAIQEGLDERKREKEDEAEKEAVAAKAAADEPEVKEPRRKRAGSIDVDAVSTTETPSEEVAPAKEEAPVKEEVSTPKDAVEEAPKEEELKKD
ncbi:small subunit ribosomal protein S2 [Pedobacter sp. UYEF25]